MIIARARGRLGNQLNFLGFLSQARRGSERVFVFGLDDLRFATVNHPSLFGSWLRHLVVNKRSFEQLEAVLRLLVSIRVVGVLREDGPTVVARTRSLLPLVIMDDGFYQHEGLVDTQPVATLRNHVLADNVEFFRSIGFDLNSATPATFDSFCFVHVRRGDYLIFPDADYPASLPAEWFREQMDRVRQKRAETVFLIFGDDDEWTERYLGGFERTRVVSCSPLQAFVAMSLCGAGILSPSSLSWWSAKLASTTGGGEFIAPRYWFWWPRKSWVDRTYEDSRFITWVDV